MSLNVISLFSGIEVAYLALKDFSIGNYYSSEIDKNCNKLIKDKYPNIIQLGDINNWETWEIDFSRIDLIIGGSPCQSFSRIGNRTGFKDTRGKLFFKYVDILNTAKKLNPNVKFLLENVRMSSENCKIITDNLLVNPKIINSKQFSPQIRERFYWFNWNLTNPPPKNEQVLSDILDDDPNHYWYAGHNHVADLSKSICLKLNIKGHDMLKRVYNPKFKSPTLTVINGGHQEKKVYIDGRIRRLSPIEYERLQGLPDNYTEGFSNTVRRSMLGNSWNLPTLQFIFNNLKKELDKN